MKREDLRSKILPTTIENTDEFQYTGNKKFNTTDSIYLDSYNEQYDGKKTDMERRISATDYAIMNNVYINYYLHDYYKTRTGRQTTSAWCRSAYDSYLVHNISGDGDCHPRYTYHREIGLCPSLHYYLPSDISSEELEQFDIREVKDLDRKNYISYITNWGVCRNKTR